jgi:hypothetical protein
MPHGHGAGFLGKQYDPFILNADPAQPNFKVPDMLPPDYISTIADRSAAATARDGRPVGA